MILKIIHKSLRCIRCVTGSQCNDLAKVEASHAKTCSPEKLTAPQHSGRVAFLQKVVGCPIRTTSYYNKYLLLTEFEGRTVSYGPSFFLLDLWPKREARGP